MNVLPAFALPQLPAVAPSAASVTQGASPAAAELGAGGLAPIEWMQRGVLAVEQKALAGAEVVLTDVPSVHQALIMHIDARADRFIEGYPANP